MTISESAVCLDRRVENPPASFVGGATVWTLPYPVPVDGSAGVVAAVDLDSGTELVVTRPSPTTVSAVGNWPHAALGLTYTWSYVPTTIYPDAPGGKDRRSKLRLSRVLAFFNDTRHAIATVTRKGRPGFSVQLQQNTPDVGQYLSIPILADSEETRIELTTDHPWPVRIGMLGWEGQYDTRSTTQVPQ